jgi:nitronate monooxygenase
MITSLQAPYEVAKAAHSYGGLALHDVVNARHARKALEAGADGLIAVAAGAGGHAGRINPLALITEIRSFFEGPLALSGAISSGENIVAAIAMGADYAYVGTRFIATEEANASSDYKQGVVDASAADIVYTNLITGVHANFLRSSIVAAGLDPDNLPESDKSKMNFQSGGNMEHRAWRDIWGAGQSVAGVAAVEPVARVIDQFEEGIARALRRLRPQAA